MLTSPGRTPALPPGTCPGRTSGSVSLSAGSWRRPVEQCARGRWRRPVPHTHPHPLGKGARGSGARSDSCVLLKVRVSRLVPRLPPARRRACGSWVRGGRRGYIYTGPAEPRRPSRDARGQTQTTRLGLGACGRPLGDGEGSRGEVMPCRRVSPVQHPAGGGVHLARGPEVTGLGPGRPPQACPRRVAEADGSFTVPLARGCVGPLGPETLGLQLPSQVDCQ